MMGYSMQIPLVGQCGLKKRRHYSRASALEHIRSLRRSEDYRPKPEASHLNIYRCPACDCFHVGHWTPQP